MFSGIIEEVGTIEQAADGVLRIRAESILRDAQLGDSIAINGVDLTVAELDERSFLANVMPETYRRSNLGTLAAGARVNLERSVRPSDRLSGHIVRGVVEGSRPLPQRHAGSRRDHRRLRRARGAAALHDRQGADRDRRREPDDRRERQNGGSPSRSSNTLRSTPTCSTAGRATRSTWRRTFWRATSTHCSRRARPASDRRSIQRRERRMADDATTAAERKPARRKRGAGAKAPAKPRQRKSAFCTAEEAIHAFSQGGAADHHRRRRARERGGSRAARAVRHLRDDQLHGHLRPRADLHRDGRRAAGSARPAADGRPEPEHRAAGHGLHRQRRGAHGASRPASPRPTARAPCRC